MLKNTYVDAYNSPETKLIYSVERSLDLITATLLLTGQITIFGVFVRPGRFSLSLGGPLFGSARLEGKNQALLGDIIINFIDVILAILLIIGKIHVTGTFVSSGEFTINVSGPIFGYPEIIPITIPQESIEQFNSIVSKYYVVPQELLDHVIRSEKNVGK